METKPTVFNALTSQLTTSTITDRTANLNRGDSKALAKSLSELALTQSRAVEEMAVVGDLTQLAMDESTATATYGYMKLASGIQMMNLLTVAGVQTGSFTEADMAALEAVIRRFIQNTGEYMHMGDALIKQVLISAGQDIARRHG